MARAESATAALRPELTTRWTSTDLTGPRLRIIDGTVQVQRALVERVYALYPLVPAGIGIAASLDTGARLGERALALLAGVVFLALGAWSVSGVLRARVLIDASGWHWEVGLRRRREGLRWDEIDEIYLHRNHSGLQDFLRSRSDRRITFDRLLPEPKTRGSMIQRASIDLLCHLQHDVAHQLGVAPIPVRVDLRFGEATVGFVHPCPICDAR